MNGSCSSITDLSTLFCAFMSKFIGVRIESAPAKGTPTVETAAKHLAETGGQMALFVVDAPSLPSLLIAPESKWGFLNVAALAADGATGKDLDRRVQREIWRGVSMVGGSGNTEMPHCLLNTVLTPLDLDRQQKYPNNGTCPPTTWVVSPKMSITNRTAYTDKKRSPDGHQNGDG